MASIATDSRDTGLHDETGKRVRAERYRRKLRLEVIQGYGGACTCCGNTFLPHLTIDHVNGGGHAERQVKSNWVLYTRLRRGLPLIDPGFRVLCWNCNAAEHFQGGCRCQEDE